MADPPPRGVAPPAKPRLLLGVAAGLVGLPANLCALAAALGFGTRLVLLHETSAADQFWATAAARLTGGAGALVLAAALHRRTGTSAPGGGRWLRPAAVLIVAVGGLDAAGNAAFAAAATESLGVAAIVASLYPAVTVLLNRSVRRERMPTVHLYGVLAAPRRRLPGLVTADRAESPVRW